MNQQTAPLAELAPGIGHNRSPDPLDPIAALKGRLAVTHRELVARFLDLELSCGRIPNPIDTEEEAGLITDFIAQCQAHLRRAEGAHKEEKAFFLQAGRAVDGFFKRRCETLGDALTPVMVRLKAYRDRVTAAACAQHQATRQVAVEEGRRAAAEAAAHRAEAERLARSAETAEDRRRAAEQLALAEAATERAEAWAREAEAAPVPVRIQGDYGSTAYVTRSWTFVVVDLDQVPRVYLSLDTEAVRAAITKQGMRDIPGLKIFQSENLRVRGAA
jgi:hypothetical protein